MGKEATIGRRRIRGKYSSIIKEYLLLLYALARCAEKQVRVAYFCKERL